MAGLVAGETGRRVWPQEEEAVPDQGWGGLCLVLNTTDV